MRFQPYRVKLRLIGQIKVVKIKPLRKTFDLVVLSELNPRLTDESILWKGHFEDSQYLMSYTAFVSIDVLYENRRANGLHRDAKLLFELADHCSLYGLAKLNRPAEGPHTFDTPSIIEHLGCK